MVSHQFTPSVGGIETISGMLVDGFLAAGHMVTVVTTTPAPPDSRRPGLLILRNPNSRQLVKAVRRADVVFHNNIALRFAWPLLFVRRPWVVAVHIWISRTDGSITIRDRLKRRILRFATVISASEALAAHLDRASYVIPNAYRDDVFRIMDECTRIPKSVVFVGRLTPDKGVETLIRAAARLRADNMLDRLTIVGVGGQRAELERLSHALGIQDITEFAGKLIGDPLVRVMNTHVSLVVPSLWNEPFGLVALEGMACGCVVIGSSGGGLAEAIGSAGITFSNGDVDELCAALTRVSTAPGLSTELLRRTPQHLQRHLPQQMVTEYLRILDLSRTATAGRRAK
jgi:glycogen(starch) synthase